MKNFSKYFLIFLFLITIVSISSISATDVSDDYAQDSQTVGSVSGESITNVENDIVGDPDPASPASPDPAASGNENPTNDEVKELSTNVTITSDNSSVVDTEKEINAKVVASDNKSIEGGNATIIIKKGDDQIYSDTIDLDENGTARFKWTPTETGIFNVLINFNQLVVGNTTWNASNATMDIIARIGTSTAITSGSSSVVFNSTNITAIVAANNGQSLNGTAVLKITKGNVVFLEKTINVTGNNMEYTWTPTETGNYTIAIVYNQYKIDDVEYTSSSGQKKFEVLVNNNLNLTVDNVVMYYKDGTKLVVSVKTEDGRVINNLTVQVKINNKTYNLVTNTNGKASLALTLSPKSYEVVSTIPNTTVKTNSKVTVNNWKKSLTSLVPKKLTKAYKSANKFSVTLKHNNVVASGEKLTVKVGKKTYYIKTNAKGVASLAFNLKPGTYTAKVSMDTAGVKMTKSAKVKVTKWQKRYATLTVKKVVKEYQDATKLQAKLTYKGDAIAGEQVKLLIKNRIYKAKTNSKGIASFRLNQIVGSYRAVSSAKVAGVSLARASTVKINPARVTLTRSDPVSWSGSFINGTIVLYPNYKKGSNIYLTFSHNNKPMVFKTVTVCIDKDKTQKQLKSSDIKVTNKKGKVSISTKKLKLGRHMFYVTYYSGDKNYYSLKWSVDFNLQ